MATDTQIAEAQEYVAGLARLVNDAEVAVRVGDHEAHNDIVLAQLDDEGTRLAAKLAALTPAPVEDAPVEDPPAEDAPVEDVPAAASTKLAPTTATPDASASSDPAPVGTTPTELPK